MIVQGRLNPAGANVREPVVEVTVAQPPEAGREAADEVARKT